MNEKNREVVVTVGTLEDLLRKPEHEQKLLTKGLAEESGYNGWSNYETWRTRHYLEQKGDLKEAFTNKGNIFAAEHAKRSPFDAVSPNEKASYDLAEELRRYFTALREMYVLDSNTTALLHAAYLNVNYEEISEDLMRDV